MKKTSPLEQAFKAGGEAIGGTKKIMIFPNKKKFPL